MSTVGSVVLVLTSILSVVAAWILWTRAQRRLRYDLKDIPGPKQQPLIGNLGSILGSSYLHKVRRSYQPFCMQPCPRIASGMRLASAIKDCRASALAAVRTDAYNKERPCFLIQPAIFHPKHVVVDINKQSEPRTVAGFGQMDSPVWPHLQMEPIWHRCPGDY